MLTANGKIEKTVFLKSFVGKSSAGKVSIRYWSPKERLYRALKLLGFAWALAVVSVILPIVHVFLVPGFFVAGPLGAFFLYKQESIVEGGKSICPDCGNDFDIVRSPNKWPLEDVCSKCHAHVTVSLEG
jgi:hypothetical protein